MAITNDVVKGTVTWFNVRRGYGFISPEYGGENLLVHQSSIKAVGYRSLAVGDAVEFVVSVGDHGRRKAVNVTGPRGSFIKDRRCFGGACYRCGEAGHMAMYCKSDVAGNTVGRSYTISNILEEEEEEINDGDREFPRGVEQRNWADLPHDVLSIIFKKITAVEIIRSAQYVCRPWRRLSYEPELWRRIFVTLPDDPRVLSSMESLAMLALDRSQGCVEDLYLRLIECKKDELFDYMSDRTMKLRRLRLISIYKMSETAFTGAIRKFSLLEELEISFCFFSSKLVESKLVEVVGSTCRQLKSFRLNMDPFNNQFVIYNDSDYNSDAQAFSIAKHMQQLQHLQLIGNPLTNIGLLAILNSCPNLQSLDIRACLYVSFDENLKSKCAKMKELRRPKDSTNDYVFRHLIGPLLSADFIDYVPPEDYDDYDDEGFSDMSQDEIFEYLFG